MTPSKKRQGILKKVGVEKDVYTLALERMENIYRSFDYVAVSFSGGKDSTACLNVCLEVARKLGRLPVPVYFVDEEVIPPDVDEYMLRLVQNPEIDLKWICVPIAHLNNALKEDKWYTWDPAKKEKWVKPLPSSAITEIPGYDYRKSTLGVSHVISIMLKDIPGRVAVVLGVRAQESLSRFRSVSRKVHENYLTRASHGDSLGGLAVRNKNIWKAYPIYDWTDSDVWTAPAKLGWDYCRAYDKMEMAGLSPHEQRIAPPFGSYSARSLWTWHVCWPEMWDKVMDRVDGVRTSAEYAKTNLYGKGDRDTINKPDGMSWPDFVLDRLSMIEDPSLREIMTRQVNNYVKSHYRATGGLPILGKVAHPDSGTSWIHLYHIVSRKDKDMRNQPSLGVIPKTDKKKYQSALQKYFEQLKVECP